jgi:hypothetical protein
MSIRQRHGRHLPWEVRIYDPSGRQVSKSFATKRDAERWERETRVRIDRGDYLDPAIGRLTLADWWETWTSMQAWRDSTRSTIDRHWRLYIQPTSARDGSLR